MDENVAKAVDRLTANIYDTDCTAYRDAQTIRARLVELEAENAAHIKMLADCFRMSGADPDGDEDWRIAPSALRAVTDLRRDYDEVLDWQERAERAEALLQEALGQVLSNIGFMAMHNVTDGSMESAAELHTRITAHLSENSRG